MAVAFEVTAILVLVELRNFEIPELFLQLQRMPQLVFLSL